jgi:uncharacterized membrane protein (UPF0127 family)
MLKLCVLFLAVSCFANVVELQNVSVQPMKGSDPVAIELEYADNPDRDEWGLMGRASLAQDQGMLFNIDPPQKLSVWMFNCYFDLSLAFLDQNRVIRDLHELPAYPEKMDPKRPVKTLEDLNKYPDNDPIVLFFIKNAYKTNFLASYFIEMDKNWFPQHGIRPGDVVLFTEEDPKAMIIHTLDVSGFDPSSMQPIVLSFEGEAPRSVWAPTSFKNRDIAFLDGKKTVIKVDSLREGKLHDLEAKAVLYSETPAQYILIALPGWLKKQGIDQGASLTWK